MIIALLAAAATSAAVCALFVLTPAGHALLDRPNNRSLHRHPVPRVGGVAIFAGIAAGVIATAATGRDARPIGLLAAAAVPLIGIGVLDDRYTLRASVRLFVQAATTVVCLFSTDWLLRELKWGAVTWPLGLLAWPATTIAVLWVSNLYNFMDGMDGLAGTMTAVGFGTLSVFAGMRGHHDIMLAAGLPAAAAAGFLVFNKPPARLFMGDSGSVPLGFLAAAIALWGCRSGAWPVTVPVIVFAPFVVDATATLAARLLRRERVWEPHRDHVYQRMVLNGRSHAAVLAMEIGYMAASSLSAAVALAYPGWGSVAALAGVIGIYAALSVAAAPRG